LSENTEPPMTVERRQLTKLPLEVRQVAGGR